MAPTDLPSSARAGTPSLALSRGRLMSIVSDTAADVAALTLPFNTPKVPDERHLRQRLSDQIRDHLLPRLADADIPAIVVVGGSTGAGKSTLVNSVLGEELSEAGVLRPTTRTPVLVANPEDASAFTDHPLAQVCRLVTSPAVPAGLALVDASDLDSVQDANRALAARLLEVADLWLFVTTAARYGDLTPWATLEAAAGRGVPIAVVLNRAPATVLPEVRRDLLGRLDSLGLADAPFFTIADAGPHEGLLPTEAVAEIRQWLELLAGRHRAAGLMRRADRSVWATLRTDLGTLAEAIDSQIDAAQALEDTSTALLKEHTDLLTAEVDEGIAAGGAPATRWVAAASTGGALASLATGGRLRRGLWGRATRERTRSLAEVAQDACDAAALRAQAHAAALAALLREAWEAAGLNDHLPTAPESGKASDAVGSDSPAESPELSPAARAVSEWRAGLAREAASWPAVSGLETTALADLVAAAACGVQGPQAAAGRLGLDAQTHQARTRLAEALAATMHSLIPAGGAHAFAPAEDLAAALRVRAAELAPLAGFGSEAGVSQ